MRRLMLAGLTLLVASALPAQDASRTSREAMRALDFLTGEWTGTASMQYGGGEETVQQTEWVHLHAGGTVLLIRGQGARVADDGSSHIVHDALATIWYDADAARYRMRTFVGVERTAVPEVEVRPDTLVWMLTAPDGYRTRYTIWRDGAGRWQEIGERAAADGAWTRFFTMTLTRRETRTN